MTSETKHFRTLPEQASALAEVANKLKVPSVIDCHPADVASLLVSTHPDISLVCAVGNYDVWSRDGDPISVSQRLLKTDLTLEQAIRYYLPSDSEG